MSAGIEDGREQTRPVAEGTDDQEELLEALGETDLVGVVLVGLDDTNADSLEKELDGVVNDAAIRRV